VRYEKVPTYRLSPVESALEKKVLVPWFSFAGPALA
jgi:hypothetical protein